MKKPTKEDLDLIAYKVKDMMAYFVGTADERYLSSAEMNVYVHLSDILTAVDEVLYYLPDIRENVISEDID